MVFYARMGQGPVTYYTPWPSIAPGTSAAPAPLPDDAPGTFDDMEPLETGPSMDRTDAAFLIGTGVVAGILLLAM